MSDRPALYGVHVCDVCHEPFEGAPGYLDQDRLWVCQFCMTGEVRIEKAIAARRRMSEFAGLSPAERAALDAWCALAAQEDDAKRRRGLEQHGDDVVGGPEAAR